MGKLDGKVAIVTGGASGIGEASARLFAEEGARVIIADILDEKGQRVADECGERALFLRTDVRQEEDIARVVGAAADRFGRLDVMFNNAGVGGPRGPIEDLDAAGFDNAVAVDLRGPFLGIKHATPVMKRQGAGSIISTSSVAGVLAGGSQGGLVYAACKAALVHLTWNVALQLGPFGIRVNCICPGVIATPIFGRGLGLSQEEAEKTVGPLKEALSDFQAIQRGGEALDIAKAALWLASDDSSFVNGQALRVDGGLPSIVYPPEKLARMFRALGVAPPGSPAGG